MVLFKNFPPKTYCKGYEKALNFIETDKQHDAKILVVKAESKFKREKEHG